MCCLFSGSNLDLNFKLKWRFNWRIFYKNINLFVLWLLVTLSLQQFSNNNLVIADNFFYNKNSNNSSSNSFTNETRIKRDLVFNENLVRILF